MMFSSLAATRAARPSAAHVPARRAPRGRPSRASASRRIDDEDPAVLGSAATARSRRTCSRRRAPARRLDARDPLAVRLDQRRLHVRHRLDRAAALSIRASSARAPSTSSATSPSITTEPSKMSG
jgi:hypothetical protein